MQCVVKDDILSSEVLDALKDSIVLANATQCEAYSLVERAIGDVNIGAVGFRRYAIVSICDAPPFERDVVGVDGVDAVSVQVGALVLDVLLTHISCSRTFSL